MLRRSDEAARRGGMSEREVRELLARWQDGDRAAFNAIFAAHRRLVATILSGMLPSASDVEDGIQQTFIEVFRSIDAFEGRAKFSSWVAKIAVNVARHALRHRRARPLEATTEVPEQLDPRPGADPGAQLAGREVAAAVQRILSKLPTKQRMAFLLHDLQGMAASEVAEALGIGIATVRTRLFYGRRRFWALAKEDPVLAGLEESSPLAEVRTERAEVRG